MAEVVQQQKAFSSIPTDKIPSFKVPTENPKLVAPSPVQQDPKDFSNIANKETSINIHPTEEIQEENAADNTDADAKNIPIEPENEQGKDANDGVSSITPTVHTNAETSPEKLQDEGPRTEEHPASTDDICVRFSSEKIQETEADGDSVIVIDSSSIEVCTEQVEEDDTAGEEMATITTVALQSTTFMFTDSTGGKVPKDNSSQTNPSRD